MSVKSYAKVSYKAMLAIRFFVRKILKMYAFAILIQFYKLKNSELLCPRETVTMLLSSGYNG